MRKLLIVVSIAFLMTLVGCAKKADEVELQNAETLTEGMLAMSGMNNVSNNCGHSGVFHKPKMTAPPGWLGPATFHIPEGTDTMFYYIYFPFSDTFGQDTLAWLAMLTPDAWTPPNDTCFVTKVDFWLWRLVQDDIWWHFILNMSPTDSVHITGSMKWHYQSTWLDYAYTVSTDTSISKAGTIDVTTSDDIKLSANFTFIVDGSGTGWGKFQDFKFVDWLFFAIPDENNYEGYYTLASESWKVKHYFPEQ